MTLDKCLVELARNYVYVSQNKYEKAKTQVDAMDYIKNICGSNTNRGAVLRRAWFDKVDYFREQEREQHVLNGLTANDYKTKWWEGC